ncbi:hypothetical protein MERGE_001065 [Pneumocystis wakefieldiae]|uniref:Uncharacterized protein n=1 Tax=Pneumocystis wakefieldiae TaxID=38082 RepID=A0A899FY13_9ASCO|nr:hypothetical protein MERGE_001065 [Pneumocystis wakefieldiae]
MEGPSTPPEQIQRLPPTPPTPLCASPQDSLIRPLKKRRDAGRQLPWLETPCPIAGDPLLSPKKTPQGIFRKKEEKPIDRAKSSFLSRNICKRMSETCSGGDSGDAVLFFDEKNPFFLKKKDIFGTEKEPIKRPDKRHNPDGFSFLFRGKKILQSFNDEVYDLKPKQLFTEMLSLNTTIDEINDEFTPSKRKRRK